MDQTAQAAPKPCPLNKAQAELLDAAQSTAYYLECIAAGTIAGPADPDASCIRKLEDAIRSVRFWGVSSGAVADAASEPTGEAQRIAAMSFDLATVVGG